MRPLARWLLFLVFCPSLACAEPESVDLGGVCKEEIECKDPADTCMTLGARSICTLSCSASSPCPDSYDCAQMEVKVEGTKAGVSGRGGYCVAESELPPNAARIAPEGERKRKRKNRRKRKNERRKSTAEESK